MAENPAGPSPAQDYRRTLASVLHALEASFPFGEDFDAYGFGRSEAEARAARPTFRVVEFPWREGLVHAERRGDSTLCAVTLTARALVMLGRHAPATPDASGHRPSFARWLSGVVEGGDDEALELLADRVLMSCTTVGAGAPPP